MAHSRHMHCIIVTRTGILCNFCREHAPLLSSDVMSPRSVHFHPPVATVWTKEEIKLPGKDDVESILLGKKFGRMPLHEKTDLQIVSDMEMSLAFPNQ